MDLQFVQAIKIFLAWAVCFPITDHVSLLIKSFSIMLQKSIHAYTRLLENL